MNPAPKLSAAVDRGQCGLSTCGRRVVATAAAVNLIKGLWLRRNKWAITSLVFLTEHWSCHSQLRCAIITNAKSQRLSFYIPNRKQRRECRDSKGFFSLSSVQIIKEELRKYYKPKRPLAAPSRRRLNSNRNQSRASVTKTPQLSEKP